MKNYLALFFRKDENFRGWKYYYKKHPAMVFFYTILSIALIFIFILALANLFLVFLISLKVVGQPITNNSGLNYLANFLIKSTFDFLKPAIYVDAFCNPSLVINILAYTLRVALQIIFFIYIRKIMFSAINNNPFERKNILRLRIIGLVFLLGPIIYLLTTYIYSSLGFVPYMIGFPCNVKISLFLGGAAYNIGGLFADSRIHFGVFAMVVAEVFKLGINLKEENDLTV